MHRNLELADNNPKMENGKTHIVFFHGPCTYGGYAVNQNGVCVRVKRAYKNKSSAVKVLIDFAKQSSN